MELSRVDSAALRIAMQEVRTGLDKIRELLRPVLVVDLTDADRAETLRAPVRLPDAGRDLAVLARQRPHLANACGYEPEAVIEDLDNLDLLAGVGELLHELKVWVDDSKLVWSAEAYQQSLTMYNVAKALAKTDGSVRTLVDPMAALFGTRRRARADGASDTDPVPA
jgi:hypothetical protein